MLLCIKSEENSRYNCIVDTEKIKLVSKFDDTSTPYRCRFDDSNYVDITKEQFEALFKKLEELSEKELKRRERLEDAKIKYILSKAKEKEEQL